MPNPVIQRMSGLSCASMDGKGCRNCGYGCMDAIYIRKINRKDWPTAMLATKISVIMLMQGIKPDGYSMYINC